MPLRRHYVLLLAATQLTSLGGCAVRGGGGISVGFGPDRQPFATYASCSALLGVAPGRPGSGLGARQAAARRYVSKLQAKFFSGSAQQSSLHRLAAGEC